jgi:hypothetical protein
MPVKKPLTQAENAVLVERYNPLVKKLLAKFANYEFLAPEDREQVASLGILEAGADHGKDATPLQVEDAIRGAFLRELRSHQKNNPRLKCPECGSVAAKPCKHKQQAAQETINRNANYAFGKTNSLLVPISDENSDGQEGIPDTSCGSFDDNETEVWLDATVKAMPEDLQPLYRLKFVERNSVAKISAATGLTRKEVAGRVEKAKLFIREHALSSASPNALRVIPCFKRPVSQSHLEVLQAERPKVVFYIAPPEPPPLPRLSTLKACMYCHSPEHKWYEHRSPLKKRKSGRKAVVRELPEREESHEELGVLCGVGDDD